MPSGSPARETEDPAERRTFDVFQGLILAVDTKDRYTKRHSEDVARYAVFLGRRLDVDPATLATIGVAGLLHDVGKIGIPDHILRKPGKLTDEEYDVVKQHVALGDIIVRDLPDIDADPGRRPPPPRALGRRRLSRRPGRRDIPLIARILAVGDAFSAMTTTRPYRKALDVREALRRLEDAAGTQLDERLVAAFVDGHRDRRRTPRCRAARAVSVSGPRSAGWPDRYSRVMTDGASAGRPGPEPGLCGTCRHSRVVATKRGSVFRLCERSATDPRLSRAIRHCRCSAATGTNRARRPGA